MTRTDHDPIRWVQLGFPHPEDPSRHIFLRADGPFALRKWYRNPTGGEGEMHLHLDLRTEQGGLEGCLYCGHAELHTRKRFPRALGISIVVVAAVLAPFTSYLSLLAATGLDLLVYATAPDEVVCYACDTIHRGFHPKPRHPHYDRTIAERLEYGDSAVMGSPMRESGTADAPDPEH